MSSEKSNPKIAVMMFPGTNCENESKYSLASVGMDCEIVRWNEPIDKIKSFDGYLIAGGWSYEDRIRAGIIAAKSNIMATLKEMDALGKPIIGICNGCQVLMESGLVPDLGIENVEMALAPNKNPKVSGFYCTWTNLKKISDCAFTDGIADDEVVPMPLAHGEGRFTTDDPKIIEELEKNNQIIFKYSTSEGEVVDEFPVNPNGSQLNIAGISNKKGNVLAMMPHPERATFKRQLKFHPLESFEDGESFAPAAKIFLSMKKFIESNEEGK